MDRPERLAPTTFDTAMERVRPLNEGQLYSVLCFIALKDPALLARAVEETAA